MFRKTLDWMANKFKKFSFFDDKNTQLHLIPWLWQGFSAEPMEPGPIYSEGSLQYNPNNSNIITLPICNISCGWPGVSFRKILSSRSCIQNLKDAFQSLRVIHMEPSTPSLAFWQQRFKLCPQTIIHKPCILCHWITSNSLVPERTKSVYLCN